MTKTHITLLMISTVCFGLSQAIAKQRPIVLESSNNDVILVHKGQAPDDSVKTLQNQQVTICLHNAVPNSGAKAFDIRKSHRPRYIAQSGHQACAKFVPTRHKIHFWKTNHQGKLSLTLARFLDLGDTDGTQVNLTWVRD